jgi:glutathione S-transferase
MRLLNALGPNPRMVRMFIAEKGLKIPLDTVDLWGAENRKEPYKEKNPSGTIPTLDLGDGRFLGETGAICEYLEELHPTPALIGSTPWERAEARQAARRVELQVSEHLYNAFRYGPGLEMFKERFRCIPEASEGLRAKGMDGVTLMNRILEGRKFLCGDRITVADLIFYSCMDFCTSAGWPADPSLTKVHAWFQRMAERPSAEASLSPEWKQFGLRA